MPISGPTMVRRQLGRRLRQLRNAARMTVADVEEANLASRVKLWRIETGQVAVKPGDVRGLCWLYGTDGGTTETLTALAFSSNSRAFWEDHNCLHGQSSLYASLESTADEIRIYEPGVVPDLVQTSDYFRGLRTAIEPIEAERDLRKRIDVHLEHQKTVFDRPSPPRLTVLLNAAALLRSGSDRDAIAGQVSWLRQLNLCDHVDIRVLQWKAGAHPAMRLGAFTILDFHNDDDPAVAHVRTLTGSRYTDEPGEVSEYRSTFRLLYEQAVQSKFNRL